MESTLVLSSSLPLGSGGWSCSQCGGWVLSGNTHFCSPMSQIYPSPNFQQFPSTLTFGPCLGFSDHIFVVGRKRGICNRCEKVVEFDSGLIQRLKKFLARATISK